MDKREMFLSAAMNFHAALKEVGLHVRPKRFAALLFSRANRDWKQSTRMTNDRV
jgi:hypothetical protein